MSDSSGNKLLKAAQAVGGVALLGYAGAKLWSAASRKQDRLPLFEQIAQSVDQNIGWYRLPTPLGLLTLVGLRHILRRENLYDTAPPGTMGAGSLPSPEDRQRLFRTVDGMYNDLQQPQMGTVGTRFGRNVPLDHTIPRDVLSPSPRRISQELLRREAFVPAKTINLLTAAWIQFMVGDWLSHDKDESAEPWRIKLEPGDTWQHGDPMEIVRLRRDPPRTPTEESRPAYINGETHWWDGSQIYGNTKEFQMQVRTGQGGKLHPPETLIAHGPQGLLPQSRLAGWWLGLALMFALFVQEHNAICERLGAAYPHWSDDDLFEHARLVNAALLAKIHTVQWTPAIISHPTTVIALRTNWWGLAGEWVHRLFGRISSSEVISGIPGARTDHFGVPYSITEEFTAVYRLHPLLPDDLELRSVHSDAVLETPNFLQVAGANAQQVIQRVSMADLLYSFGRMFSGAVRLHNYPRSLQEFPLPGGRTIDLGSHDILRTRELGVPRYNQFRRLFHLPAPRTFEELTDNPAWADQIRRVYNNDIEAVDLIVGMFAEPLPPGFGFSDTAFRVFILMASRRLNSDRFFTTYFTPEVYSPVGMEWIENNDLTTVLGRHYPELVPALHGVSNPFAPWTRVKA